jgi:hypothetical protein
MCAGGSCTGRSAPGTLWLNLSLYNTALCIVLYREGLPARVVAVNDSGHLPEALRGAQEYPEDMRW